MDSVYDRELRNLKSESQSQPSIFERVKGLFAQSDTKSSSNQLGKLDRKPMGKSDDDIES
jgi:hypothetical protein